MFLKVINFCLDTRKVEELSKENLRIAPLLYRLTPHAHDLNSLYLLSGVWSKSREFCFVTSCCLAAHYIWKYSIQRLSWICFSSLWSHRKRVALGWSFMLVILHLVPLKTMKNGHRKCNWVMFSFSYASEYTFGQTCFQEDLSFIFPNSRNLRPTSLSTGKAAGEEME